MGSTQRISDIRWPSKYAIPCLFGTCNELRLHEWDRTEMARGELLHLTGGESDVHVGDRFVGSITSISGSETTDDIGYLVHCVAGSHRFQASVGRTLVVEIRSHHPNRHWPSCRLRSD